MTGPAIIPVSTLEEPRLAPYLGLRDAELAQRCTPDKPDAHGALGGLFVAEGELVVRRLIESRFMTESVLLAENRLRALEDALASLPDGTPVFIAPQTLLNSIVGFNMHRGVLAMGRRHRVWPLDKLLADPGPILILEDLVNHDNLGAIFRNAAGLGGPGCSILLSPRCADPLYRKSLRVSMGHVLGVPFHRLTNWPTDLHRVRSAGWRILAMTPDDAAADLAGVSPGNTGRTALLLGSEGPGLTPEALAAADARVRIAMPAGRSGARIDSLNVAMAAGIALHRLVVPV